MTEGRLYMQVANGDQAGHLRPTTARRRLGVLEVLQAKALTRVEILAAMSISEATLRRDLVELADRLLIEPQIVVGSVRPDLTYSGLAVSLLVVLTKSPALADPADVASIAARLGVGASQLRHTIARSPLFRLEYAPTPMGKRRAQDFVNLRARSA